MQKKDGKDIVKRFGWLVISNDSHSRVGIIDIGNILSQEVKANLGIELKEDQRTNEEMMNILLIIYFLYYIK